MTIALTRSRACTLLALAVAGSAGTAAAAEYCVTCAEPPAMYACVVAGTAPDAPADAREQLLCITELAKSGAHATCSVPRSAPKPCPGVFKIVALPQGGLPPVPSAATAEPEEPNEEMPEGVGAAAPASPPVNKSGEPKTVEELAKQTVQSSKEELEKAGEAVKSTAKKAGDKVEDAGSAVGNAAKKTWDCIKSLFSDC